MDTLIRRQTTGPTQSFSQLRSCLAARIQNVAEVCNWKYGNNGWLGLAQIWISGGHITQGVSKNNDTYFDTSTYDTPAWRQFVTCQEIGHTFGLGHQDEDFYNANLGSCMDYTVNPILNQHPDRRSGSVGSSDRCISEWPNLCTRTGFWQRQQNHHARNLGIGKRLATQRH
jgi:hypothetical protein